MYLTRGMLVSWYLVYRFIALNFVDGVDFIIRLVLNFEVFWLKNLFTLTMSLPMRVLGKHQKKDWFWTIFGLNI